MKNFMKIVLFSLVMVFGLFTSCTKDETVTPETKMELFEKHAQLSDPLSDHFTGRYAVAYYVNASGTITTPSPDSGLLAYLNSIIGDTIANMGLSDNQETTHLVHYDRNNNGIIDQTDVYWFGQSNNASLSLNSIQKLACYSSGWTCDYIPFGFTLSGNVFYPDDSGNNLILIRGYYDDIGSGYCDGEFNSFDLKVFMTDGTRISVVMVRLP